MRNFHWKVSFPHQNLRQRGCDMKLTAVIDQTPLLFGNNDLFLTREPSHQQAYDCGLVGLAQRTGAHIPGELSRPSLFWDVCQVYLAHSPGGKFFQNSQVQYYRRVLTSINLCYACSHQPPWVMSFYFGYLKCVKAFCGENFGFLRWRRQVSVCPYCFGQHFVYFSQVLWSFGKAPV